MLNASQYLRSGGPSCHSVPLLVMLAMIASVRWYPPAFFTVKFPFSLLCEKGENKNLYLYLLVFALKALKGYPRN